MKFLANISTNVDCDVWYNMGCPGFDGLRLANIISGNGSLPVGHKAIHSINADMLIKPIGTLEWKAIWNSNVFIQETAFINVGNFLQVSMS